MEGSKLYVGNLNYGVTNTQLQDLFSPFGEVKNINIIEGKGFGFVEMGSNDEAEKAKAELDGTEFEGRTMRVDVARPRKPRQDNRRGGYGGGGGRY